MIYRYSDKPLAVISYDTQTFFMLSKFLSKESNEILTRIDPDDFINNPDDSYQYINLVVKNFDQRKKISSLIDENSFNRWSLVVDDSTNTVVTINKNKNLSVGQGCFIYPGVWAYSGTIGNDVIVHSMVKLAENILIGNGCYLSGNITIAGSCIIGDWCYFGNDVFIIDNVTITDNVRLLPGMGIRKSINQPGTYYNPNVFEIKKLGAFHG